MLSRCALCSRGRLYLDAEQRVQRVDGLARKELDEATAAHQAALRRGHLLEQLAYPVHRAVGLLLKTWQS